MCLFTKDKEPKIAQEDITVYKVMRVSTVGGAVHGAPPFRYEYTYYPGLNVPLLKVETPKESRSFDRWCSVGEGYLHAYTDIKAATMAVKLQQIQGFPMTVVKMYIPAGTPYYLGVNCDIAAAALYWPVEDKNA